MSHCVSKGIDVKLSLEEKAKKGGYRCVTLKIFDYKGGDFVENQDLSMVVVDQRNQQILSEIPSRLSLNQSPEGLFKRVEIGINNYDPSLFMNQSFTIYFFREKDGDVSQPASGEESKSSMLGLLSEMPRGEYETLMERIENDLVAFG